MRKVHISLIHLTLRAGQGYLAPSMLESSERQAGLGSVEGGGWVGLGVPQTPMRRALSV